MNFRISGLFAAFAFACLLGIASKSLAQNAYITRPGINEVSNTVSVINTATNTVIATIPVGIAPFGVAVSPDGSKVYVTGEVVSVIATAMNTVTATIPVGIAPTGVAVTPDGSKVFAANGDSNSVQHHSRATLHETGKQAGRRCFQP